MRLSEQEHIAPISPKHDGLLSHLAAAQRLRLPSGDACIRFAVTGTDSSGYQYEIGVLSDRTGNREPDSLFQVRQRAVENTGAFNAALIVPTGIGAEIGGHAGDATPIVRLLAQCCDTVITHPNVVNASDINEMTDNTLYVEGSVLSRLLMGMIGLQRVRANRVLTIIDAHVDQLFENAAVNAVSAARATLGLTGSRVVRMDPPLKMTATYTASGRAAGEVHEFERICRVLDDYEGQYDAVAIASVIDVPEEYHRQYFGAGGEMVNPWGGVEALLTHAISSLYNVPSAHSPMLESREISSADMGEVEPRLAAEAISLAFLHCALKGLHRSPRIVTDADAMRLPEVMTAEDVSCLVIPDKCLGLPTLAALEQGIPVIAVRENENLMKNDLTALPWQEGQFFLVDNYWEAVGVLNALKAGIDPRSVRRPMRATVVETTGSTDETDVLTA